MKRFFIISFAVVFGAVVLTDPADACHHRRARRHGCGGGGNGGCGPVYYDEKGGYQDYGTPNVPPPAPPPAPRAT